MMNPTLTDSPPDVGHQFMWQAARIRGLPEHLRVVPNDPVDWTAWATAVKAYREKRRRECSQDIRQQHIELERCRRDTAYWICMYGVIFEPRRVGDVAPQWKPFILFPFQVQMVRWIEHVMDQDDLGRGDGVVEKSRDMGATNIFCAVAVKHFLYDDVYVCGFISRNFDQVDKKNSSDTIFYKIRALLGTEDAVSPNLRLPRWQQPQGFDPYLHVALGAIRNPEPGRTCFLLGETTTRLSGVGGRSTMRVNDEGARFDAFGEAWSNQQATTDTRFALSSADLRFGPDFYNLARTGKAAAASPFMEGPSYLRLDWRLHPFHTPEWFDQQRARAVSGGDPHKFSREYEINYFAELGEEVYPRFRNVTTEHAPYDPNGGPLMVLVDPGVRDPTAIIWLQRDYLRGGWNVVESFEGRGGEDAMFYASVLTGVYLSGNYQYEYDSYPRLNEIMEFTAGIIQQVTYVGDPAGTSRGGRGDSAATWNNELQLAAKQISGKTIYIQTITANNARSYEMRKQAVNALLPQFRFHNGEGGSRVLHCLQESRYKKAPRGAEANEPPKPLHDEFSHIRSAFEYGAVWNLMMVRSEQRGSTTGQKPIRRSLSGNIVSGRQAGMFQKSPPRVRRLNS